MYKTTIRIRYDKCMNEIESILGKKPKDGYTISDCKRYLQQKYHAKEVSLENINLIMKRGYRLYHKKCSTPMGVSEQMVTNEDYVTTYIIEGLQLNSKAPDSVYTGTGIIIGSEDKKHISASFVAGGTYDLGMELEIFEGETVESLLKRFE